MITIRQSSATSSNKAINETAAKPKETNSEWLKRVGATNGVLLLGGADISHFRIRVAQSHARADLKPSCWSLAGMLVDSRKFLSVPLELCDNAADIAAHNAVKSCKISEYDDPERFPNIAVIQFTSDATLVLERAKLLGGDGKKPAQRGIIDLPTLMLPWLSYIWIAGKASNPLVDGLGLPSAAFVETAYGIAGIELTPGLASAASCPEAIWQAAKYWQDFYQGAAETTHQENAPSQVPIGNYAVRQKAATASWPPDKK